MTRILLIEDETILAESIADGLNMEGYQVSCVNLLSQARELLERIVFDLVLLDITLPDGNGLDFLDYLTKHTNNLIVIILTSDASLATAVRAIKSGAYDYLAKPFEIDILLHRINNALTHREAEADMVLKERLNELDKYAHPIVACPSRQMKELYQRVQKVAAIDNMTVLITGETGVGKEHICRMIHEMSPRSKQPFIAINCANLDRTLLQSELFGHEKGAFTGAVERRKGLFECAGNGTLFLDEVSEMPSDVQASFLRVLETKRFRRLGGSTELATNARVLASTNQDLQLLVKRDRFREDLYFRLHQLELYVPPLRSRLEDIRPLAEHFCAQTARSLHIKVNLTEDAINSLINYPWPGNIRELKNLIERTIVIRGGGPITAKDLQLDNQQVQTRQPAAPVERPATESPFPSLGEIESAHIMRALEASQGNKTQAAKLLGIARSSLVRKLEEMEKNN